MMHQKKKDHLFVPPLDIRFDGKGHCLLVLCYFVIDDRTNKSERTETLIYLTDNLTSLSPSTSKLSAPQIDLTGLRRLVKEY